MHENKLKAFRDARIVHNIFRDELSPSAKLIALIQQKPLDTTLKGVWGYIHQNGIFISHNYTVGVEKLLT